MKFVKIKEESAMIAVDGKFDVIVCADLRDEMTDAFNNGCVRIEVDFSKTTFIDSSGVGILLEFRQKVNGEIYAKNVNGLVLKLFKSSMLMADLHVNMS